VYPAEADPAITRAQVDRLKRGALLAEKNPAPKRLFPLPDPPIPVIFRL
jgi:hypothetical protein